MVLEKTEAYITTVNADHKIILPDNMPVGAKVAVILMPMDIITQDDEARRTRFAATLKAIQSASNQVLPTLSDSEPDALVERVRKSRQ